MEGFPGTEIPDGWAKTTELSGSPAPSTAGVPGRFQAPERRTSERNGRKPGRDASGDITKPDPTPAKAEKRTASRYYLLKSGHALTGMCLMRIKNRPDDHCWWCDPGNINGTLVSVTDKHGLPQEAGNRSQIERNGSVGQRGADLTFHRKNQGSARN